MTVFSDPKTNSHVNEFQKRLKDFAQREYDKVLPLCLNQPSTPQDVNTSTDIATGRMQLEEFKALLKKSNNILNVTLDRTQEWGKYFFRVTLNLEAVRIHHPELQIEHIIESQVLARLNEVTRLATETLYSKTVEQWGEQGGRLVVMWSESSPLLGSLVSKALREYKSDLFLQIVTERKNASEFISLFNLDLERLNSIGQTE